MHSELYALRAALEREPVQLPGNWVAIPQAELDKLQQQVHELTRQRDDLRAALNESAVAIVEDRNFRNKWFNEGYTTALKDRRAAMTANDAELDAQLFASNKR